MNINIGFGDLVTIDGKEGNFILIFDRDTGFIEILSLITFSVLRTDFKNIESVIKEYNIKPAVI